VPTQRQLMMAAALNLVRNVPPVSWHIDSDSAAVIVHLSGVVLYRLLGAGIFIYDKGAKG